MSTIKITIGAMTAVCALALTAFGAVSASAVEFAPLYKFAATPKVGKTLPTRIRGVGVGPQEFIFKKLRVTCQAARVFGEITSAESETLALTVAYKECVGGPFSFGNIQKVTLPESVRGKAALVYSYAGWVEAKSEVPMVVKYLKCMTDWLPGIYPEAAAEKPTKLWQDGKYQTEEVANANAKFFPTGKQKKLMITNEIQGTGLEWEEEEVGACEGEGIRLSEGETGKYKGKLLVEIPNGNIEFKAPEA